MMEIKYHKHFGVDTHQSSPPGKIDVFYAETSRDMLIYIIARQ